MNSSKAARGSARPKTDRTFDRAYTYHDIDGRELFQHVRWITEGGRGKDFTYRWRMHKADPYWINKKPTVQTAGYDADNYLYRLPEVLRAKQEGLTIWWPEGEKDAESLEAAGVVATTHHGAANNVHIEQAMWLRGARQVVLLADRDAPGFRCALTRWELLTEYARLDPRQIKVMRACKGKDVSDHLAAGYGLADLVPVSVARLRRRAAEYTPASAAAAGYGYVGLTVISKGREHKL